MHHHGLTEREMMLDPQRESIAKAAYTRPQADCTSDGGAFRGSIATATGSRTSLEIGRGSVYRALGGGCIVRKLATLAGSIVGYRPKAISRVAYNGERSVEREIGTVTVTTIEMTTPIKDQSATEAHLRKSAKKF
jgi:hypothetical protein